MAKIQCAISGLHFSCDHGPFTITSQDGYFHPSFAVPYKNLYDLYLKHCNGYLTSTDSYLLFLAFLHSTEQIEWKHSATCKPKTPEIIAFVENNLHQLIQVIEATNIITVPSFKQPSFVVTEHNSNLKQIPNWIAAWESNIIDFKEGYASEKTRDDLTKLENKFSYFLKSGADPREYAFIVANWANKAAIFPISKIDYWTKLIRSCFNSTKMFSTPIADIKEVKEYCEENIEAGSIHYHALMTTLREGSVRHTDFLGLTSVNSLGYNLLPTDTTKNQTEIEAVIAKAPMELPKRTEYKSNLDFIKAKLRYRVALNIALKNKESNHE